jgi:trimeric autotransporter adhesin
MKNFYARILPLFLFLFCFQFSFSQVSITATLGTPGPTSYTTLKAAFAAVNAGTHKGDITVSISANTTETGAILLNASGIGSSSYTSVLVKPAASATPLITSDSAIVLNGATNVTIDGSNTVGGTTKNLTVSNTSLNGPTVIFQNGASANTVKNCIIKGVTTNFGVVTFGNTTGAGNNNNTVQNNDITKGATSPIMGIYNIGTSGTPNTGNIIRANRIMDFSFYGFSDGNPSGGYSNNTLFELNEIFSATTQTGNLTGIILDNPAGISNITISRNRIHDLLTSAPGATINGIDVYDVVSATISNNMIALSNTSADITGIYQESGTNATSMKIWYNSVSIYGTATGTAESYVFYKDYQSTTDDVKNNIFSNTRVSSGTGGQYAIVQTSGSMVSNYNDLYSSGNSMNVIGYKGSSYTTLAAWQAGTSLDANSVSVAPVFTSPTDLHLVPGSNPGLDNKGTPVTVTIDFDNDTRSVTPDIGADEMAAGADTTPPSISYTALTFSCTTGDRSLTANIIDATGVPVSGSLVPRIYFKKSTGGTWFSTAGVLSSGTATNGTWTFTISSTAMGGVAVNDNIQYYIIAQDAVTPTPNIASSPSGAVASNVNTVTTAPATPNSYTVNASLSGNFTVGSGGTYATLTAAINAYNNGCLSGPVVFSLISSTYGAGETFPLVIKENPAASATNTLTIKPASGMTVAINADTAAFIFDAADYVSIDGSNTTNGTTKNLTINKTLTTGATIIFQNGATNDVVKNSIVKGVATGTGVILLSGTNTSTGNNNNLIQNNDVTKGATSPIAGIFNVGTAGKPNTSNSILGNRIMDFSGYGFIDGDGTVGFSDNTLFEGNEIFENSVQTTALIAIRINNASGITNMIISKNKIHDLFTSSTGTIAGIDLFDAVSVTVSNNMIAIANSTASVRGIAQETAVGAVIKIVYNTVSLTGAPTGTLSSYAFLKNYTSTNDDVRDNIFYNNRISSGTGNQYAIANVSTGTMVSNYNNLVSTGNALNFTGKKGTTDYGTLAAWQTGSAGDANSIAVVPVFTSPTDLHLVPGSNAGIDNKGTPISGITTDVDNDTRSATTPDIGADEMLSCTPPTVTSPNTFSICSGTSPNIVLTASAPATFAWTIGTITGSITGATAGNGSTISQVLTNSGTSAGSVQYLVTATSSGCNSQPYTITGTINPAPTITSASTATICSGMAQNYVITSATPGVTLTWSRPAVAGISNAAVSNQSSNIINEALNNTTSSPVTVIYQVTASASGCTGPVFNYTVTVNPKPVASFTTSSPACSGSAVTFTNTSTGSVTSLSWDFGDGNSITSTTSTQSHTYAAAGTFNVQLSVLSGSGCVSDTFTQAVVVSQGTSITTQPASQSACTGSAVNFSVTASGSSLTYQWRKNGVSISGATSSTYTIPAATSADAGNYDVVVTGGCGVVTSSVASLTLNSAPVINTQPQSQAVCTGSPVTFTVVASGSGLTYTWRKNGVLIPGATTANYTIASAAAGDVGSYDVVVATSCSTSTTSNAATLTLNTAPAITTQPASQTVCSGTTATFNVVASGSGLNYQWRKGGTAITGATSSTFSIASVTTAAAGSYDVVVTNACTSVTSATVTLTVNAATVITTQPVNQTACTGGSVTFTVTATGTGLTYQWRKAGVAIAGATSSTFTIPAAVTTDAGNYDVIISGSCGPVTSNTVTLTLNTAPAITSQPVGTSACAGSSVSLSVTASGTGLSYQWRKGGVAIAGATSSTYTINPVAVGSAGSYDVVISSACGTNVTSNAATVTVTQGTVITAQPVSQSVCEGSIATLSVTASGSGTITYQWRKNSVAIAGATTANYQIVNALISNSGIYDVIISSSCGTVTSQGAILAVNSCTSVPAINSDVTSAVLMPNVMHSSTRLHIVMKRAVRSDWVVTDANGNAVMKFSKQLAAGANDIGVQVQQLASGIYQVTGHCSNGNLVVLRFIKQ